MLLSEISEIAGFVIALAGIALIWQQKIYIDTHTKQITKIALPFGIKLQTNAPVIAIIFMGFALILVPVLKQSDQHFVALKGHVKSPEPLMVYAVAAQQQANGDVQLEVPGNTYYTIMYLPRDGANTVDTESVDLVKRHQEPFQLRPLQVGQLLAGNTAIVPAGPVQKEPANIVNQFK